MKLLFYTEFTKPLLGKLVDLLFLGRAFTYSSLGVKKWGGHLFYLLLPFSYRTLHVTESNEGEKCSC